MTIVLGLDQHRAQITAEWVDTVTGEVSRSRVAPAHRESVRKFLARFDGPELEVALEATSEYSTGLSSGAAPWRIAAGPDGNLWFTDPGLTKVIGVINPVTHAISEYSTGLNSGAFPWGIAAGPDGNLWFTDIFIVHQTTGATPRTYFILSQPLTGCQTPVGPAHIASEAKVFEARAKRRKGPRSRHVWVTEQGGRFNTQGQYVSTSVEGTTWLTADTCTSSSVTVSQGVVKVRDLVRRRTVTLHAGQSYTARKRR